MGKKKRTKAEKYCQMCRESSGRGGNGQEKAHKGRNNIARCSVKLAGGKAKGKKKLTKAEKYRQEG